MSIGEVTMYRVMCDGSDCTKSPQDDTEYYALADVGYAEDEAADNDDWIVVEVGSFGKKKHYCPDHWTWDEVSDEKVPAP